MAVREFSLVGRFEKECATERASNRMLAAYPMASLNPKQSMDLVQMRRIVRLAIPMPDGEQPNACVMGRAGKDDHQVPHGVEVPGFVIVLKKQHTEGVDQTS